MPKKRCYLCRSGAIFFSFLSDNVQHELQQGSLMKHPRICPPPPNRSLYRYQAWVDHLNSVIDVAPLGARLDVPLLRRADADTRVLPPQQKQHAPGELGTHATNEAPFFVFGGRFVASVAPYLDQRKMSFFFAKTKL